MKRLACHGRKQIRLLGTDQHRICRIKISEELKKMKGKESLWEMELWTQSEVADYYRVVSATVKNWRDQGLLSYWQAPGSSRVLYFREDIKLFKEKNTVQRKGGGRLKLMNGIKIGKPVVSTEPIEDWRI